MAVTYTTAAERDARPIRSRSTSNFLAEPLEIALLAASFFAAALLLATYAGVIRGARSDSPAAVVNLNTVTDAQRLEAVLEPALPLPADRRLAARELFAFLSQTDGSRRVLANVGAIARVRVPAATIDRVPNASAFRDRLRQERDRAKSDGRETPSSVSLLTGADLSAIKSAFVVRDLATVRRSLVTWVVLYLLGFHLVSIVWRVRGIPGDRVLLVCAHVLTALGFAAMVSRPDPLRDCSCSRATHRASSLASRDGRRVVRQPPDQRFEGAQLSCRSPAPSCCRSFCFRRSGQDRPAATPR